MAPSGSLPKTVYLSLGSNLGDRAAHLDDALHRLQALGTVASVSSFYETEPVEFTAQPWFLNCAVTLITECMPRQLLAGTLAIERALGRRRAATPNKGPRTIDIDILLFGNSVVNLPSLKIPHPALHQRRFVLEPLAEIAADVRHPALHKTVRELLESAPASGQAVRRLVR